MNTAKLNGIKNFTLKHFDKLIFLNCLVMIVVLFRHNVLFSLDGGGRYASARDLFEVGLHGFNDHFFLGNIQNLFYPPLQDFLLGLLIKINEVILGGLLSDRVVYSLFIFSIFSFYIYSLYAVCRVFKAWFAKFFVILFSSWTLYINLYFFEIFFGHELNFYKKPLVIYFQGLSFQDIYTVGLTNQFLCAGFLILGILALLRNDRNKTIIYITASILTHFIFGLVIVLLCTIKKVFEKDFRNLVLIGAVTFGLTAFFLIPLIAYRSYMINVYSMPLRSGFWLTAVTFMFLFLKKGTFSYKIGFGAFALVAFIGLAKLSEKYLGFLPNFHFYRLLQPSMLLLILALGFAFNEEGGRIRKSLLALIFTATWIVNFGGHYWAPDIFSVYEPKIEKIDFPKSMDLSEGRSYFFSLERPIDFTIDLNLYIQRDRHFFPKGLYWESALSNLAFSTPHYTLMQGPSVLNTKLLHDITPHNCEVYRCVFNSMLNSSVSSEVWLPPSAFLDQTFSGFSIPRERFSTCWTTIVAPLTKSSGTIKYKNFQYDRYINPNTSIIRPYSDSLSANADDMFNKCTENPYNDGRVEAGLQPKLTREKSGSYLLQLPSEKSDWLISLQYFPGFKYSFDRKSSLIPGSEKLGMKIRGAGETHLYFERTFIMSLSYVISILTSLALAIWYWANRRKSNHPER